MARYATESAHPVEIDAAALRALGVSHLEEADLLAGSPLVRHDPLRTAEALVQVFGRLEPHRARSG